MSRLSRLAARFATCLGLAATPAAALEILPHEAIYGLDLVEQSAEAGILRLEGRLVWRWARVCDGWEVEQRDEVTILVDRGAVITEESVYDAWESSDGRDLRFNLIRHTNGILTYQYSGIATISDDGMGTAHYRLPGPQQLQLPADTLFPVTHSLDLLRRAQAGEAAYSAWLFDVANGYGVSELRTTIGPPNPVAGSPEAYLSETASWPVEMTYYPAADGAGAPAYRVEARLHANGVMETMDIDVGDFVVRASLSKLVVLPEPEC